MSRRIPKSVVTIFFWILFGIALCLLFGHVMRLDTREFLSALEHFSYPSLALGLVLVLAQISCQISRLWVLFPNDVKMPWGQAAQIFVSGQFVSNFIQGQAGHAVKIAIASKVSVVQGRKLSIAESTAIVLIDKFIDVFTLIGLTTLAALQIMSRGQAHFFENLNVSLMLGILLIGVAIIVGIGITRHFSARVKLVLLEFRQGLKVIRDPRKLSQGFGMALGDWVMEGWLLYTLCVAQGYPLSQAQLMVCLFLLNVGISAPISIANLGTFEAALTLALTQMGLPWVTSIAIATIFHLFQMLGILLWMLANTISRGNRTQSIKSE